MGNYDVQRRLCNIELATGALEPFLPTGEARLELLHGSRS